MEFNTSYAKMEFAPSYRKPKLMDATSAIEFAERNKLVEADKQNLGQLVERVNHHIRLAVERGSHGISFKVPHFVGMSMYDPEEMLPKLAQYLRQEGKYQCEEFPPNTLHIRWEDPKKKVASKEPISAVIQDVRPSDAKTLKSTGPKAPAKKTPAPKKKATEKKKAARKPAKKLVAVR